MCSNGGLGDGVNSGVGSNGVVGSGGSGGSAEGSCDWLIVYYLRILCHKKVAEPAIGQQTDQRTDKPSYRDA